MATRRRRTAAKRTQPVIPEPPPPIEPGEYVATDGGQPTGRSIVVFRDDVVDDNRGAAIKALKSVAGVSAVASAADYDNAAMDAQEATEGDAVFFPELGVAVVNADDSQLEALVSVASDGNSNIVAIEPEYWFFIIAESLTRDYLRGFRDAANHLYGQLDVEAEGELEALAGFQDTPQATWGLQATRVIPSQFTGQGIRVAVLDTGFDLQHPDFRGRRVVSQSFIPGQTPQDGHGHGTHCIGTACGPQRPASGVRRYGVAGASQIFVGKVLSNGGSSVGGSVLAGMNWAVANRCQVISMSLGSHVNQVSQAFEQAGRRALQAGCVMVAAAGNNANRQAGQFGFVEQPANSPSIMAVAAIDSQLRVANFSARSSTVTGVGGKVDIAAPGVAVFSSWSRRPNPPSMHYTISGTSMATPHVAGIAALWAQSTNRVGHALWSTLIQNIRALTANGRDVGSGLTQAP